MLFLRANKLASKITAQRVLEKLTLSCLPNQNGPRQYNEQEQNRSGPKQKLSHP